MQTSAETGIMRAVGMRQMWSSIAPQYVLAANRTTAINRELSSQVSANAKTQANLRILDVASGVGEPGLTLAKDYPGCKVTVTDFASGMVDEAQKRATAAGLENVRFAVAEATDLSQFDDSSFEVVTCSLALQAVPDYGKGLAELKRVLQPDGLVLITTWGKTSELDMWRTTLGAMSNLMPSGPQTPNMETDLPLSDPQALRKAIEEGGFRDVELRKLNVVFDLPTQADQHAHFQILPPLLMARKMLEQRGAADADQQVDVTVRESAKNGGFLSGDGKMLFPTNTAFIVTARAGFRV